MTNTLPEDRFVGTDLEISQCADCKYNRPKAICKFYPEAIPNNILLNEVKCSCREEEEA